MTLTIAVFAGCVQAPEATQSTTRNGDTVTAATAQPTGTGTTGGTEAAVVELTDELTFAPDTLTVPAGSTVVWENVGSVSHSVTAFDSGVPDNATYFASGGFESESAAREAYPEGEITEGESYSHTFDTPGEYRYFCIPHEQAGMTGTVTVE